jgi:hypothetical protein
MKISRDEGRVVVSNAHWAAIVPWWATWPFEILRRFPGSIYCGVRDLMSV